MGTRARVEVFNEAGKCIVSIYRQFDGYPSGLGAELAEFLTPRTIVNGIGHGRTSADTANGIECLAAQLVAHLKGDQLGNVYLYPPMTEDRECGEEFIYHITGDDKTGVHVAVTDGDITMFGQPNNPASFKGIFSGTLAEFVDWLAKEAAST